MPKKHSASRAKSHAESGPNYTVVATVPKNAAEDVAVALDQLYGHDLLDVRVRHKLGGGRSPRLTTRGISIGVEALPGLITALNAAADEARVRGLLPARDGSQ